MYRLLPVLLAALLIGCGGKGGSSPAAAEQKLTPVQANPPAPKIAEALVRVPDGPAARRRLGYVDFEKRPGERIVAAVLGEGARPGDLRIGARLLPPPATPPERSAIAPNAMAVAQSCLGDAEALTLLGPGTMGEDAALGVGLTPNGLQICAAPRYLRDIDAIVEDMRRRFGPAATVGEQEVGEREIASAVVPVASLRRADLVDLLAGGESLRALAW